MWIEQWELLDKTLLYNLHNTFLWTNSAPQNELIQVGQIFCDTSMNSFLKNIIKELKYIKYYLSLVGKVFWTGVNKWANIKVLENKKELPTSLQDTIILVSSFCLSANYFIFLTYLFLEKYQSTTCSKQNSIQSLLHPTTAVWHLLLLRCYAHGHLV